MHARCSQLIWLNLRAEFLHMRQLISLFILSLSFLFTQAQENSDLLARKSLTIHRIMETPVIDGNLDEMAWQGAAVAKNFVQNDPVNGAPEPNQQRSEIYIAYDDVAIYFGARLYDIAPDSIMRELGQRDDNGRNTDYFAMWINPYQDGINDINFFVTAAGVQIDSRSTSNGDDINWDAVWESAVQIDDKGWVVEAAIPYSALRFPNTDVQTWGLNMGRYIRRTRALYTWSFIDNSKGNPEQYAGVLNGIKNIKPPLRLSALPFISGYANNFNSETAYEYNAGMDIKYGLSESFTLDMTLVPDFGQVAFDNQVLNLSPFEIRFAENRPFFTEGTELFNKGGLFYSRRVGNAPTQMVNGSELGANEVIVSNPNQVQLLNATKVSGTTNKNMGVGIFNAITGNTYAEVKDTETGESRRVLTESLANYNVLVFDQRFNQNSSITLVNTNVIRQGNSFRDANVTGLLADVANKNNTYRFQGSFKKSMVFQSNERVEGFANSLQFNKVGGNFRFYAGQNIESDQYQINDLGFLTNNNEFSHYAGLSYQIFQPTEKFNRYGYFLNVSRGMLYNPRVFTYFNVNANAFFVTKNFTGFGFNAGGDPVSPHDYFEARTPGRVFVDNPGYYMGGWVSTDYRKRYAIDFGMDFGTKAKFDHLGFKPYFVSSRLSRRMRINNQFLLIFGITEAFNKSDLGWVPAVDQSFITFGKRDVNNFTMNIRGTYIFTPLMNLALNFRHNWTRVKYHDFYILEEDGSLTFSPYEGGEFDSEGNFQSYHNANFNSWNIDLIYTWRFAPGSDLIFAWKNAVFTLDDRVEQHYYENLNAVFVSPSQNNVSIKLIYYLDSQDLKRKKP